MYASDSLKVLIEELANGNPLIILSTDGELAHAVVLTEVTFFETTGGGIALTEMVVRDPWPDNPNRRVYSSDEINGTFSVIKVSAG